MEFAKKKVQNLMCRWSYHSDLLYIHNSKEFRSCINVFKAMATLLDQADFTQCWSSISEGMISTGLPCLFLISAVEQLFWKLTRLFALVCKGSITRCQKNYKLLENQSYQTRSMICSNYTQVTLGDLYNILHLIIIFFFFFKTQRSVQHKSTTK